MSKSAHLRVADVRAIYELVNECRELGDDPTAWRRHFASRLGAWTGSAVVSVFELENGGRGWRGIADWGWEESGLDRAAFDRMVRTAGTRGLEINPVAGLYLAAAAADDGVALTRADLLGDAAFYRSEFFQEYHRPIGADALMNCIRSIPGDSAGASGLFLTRPLRVADFGRRHRSLVREAHAQVTRLIGGPLARFGEPTASDLPPRVQQVLRCVLEGDGDKQVARRLGISSHTVNQYVKAIFSHFGVRSRPELLARWIRRGWANGFARAKSDGQLAGNTG
jgi:DNA-binding CsgD family transcriptional regulator